MKYLASVPQCLSASVPQCLSASVPQMAEAVRINSLVAPIELLK
jgi:hypothetical protein